MPCVGGASREQGGTIPVCQPMALQPSLFRLSSCFAVSFPSPSCRRRRRQGGRPCNGGKWKLHQKGETLMVVAVVAAARLKWRRPQREEKREEWGRGLQAAVEELLLSVELFNSLPITRSCPHSSTSAEEATSCLSPVSASFISQRLSQLSSHNRNPAPALC